MAAGLVVVAHLVVLVAPVVLAALWWWLAWLWWRAAWWWWLAGPVVVAGLIGGGWPGVSWPVFLAGGPLVAGGLVVVAVW